MVQRQHAYIAPDGWYFVLPVLVALGLAAVFEFYFLLLLLLVLLVLLVLLFRDPSRVIPSRPKGVLSPVDGRVISVDSVAIGVLERPAWRICIRVNNLGAYTARSPIEGRVMELRGDRLSRRAAILGVRGLWVQGDDGTDVVVLLHAVPLLGRPRALIRYGERVGQGRRCAWLRVARDAEVYIPQNARVAVGAGDRVLAGSTVLAYLPREEGERAGIPA